MRRQFFVFLAALCFAAFSRPLMAQQAIPDSITRPQQGEDPLYPRDSIIGELGPGASPEPAYRAARNVLSALLRNARESSLFAEAASARVTAIFGAVTAVSPEKYRIGGGRIMADGAVSFLFRFMGRELGIAGELYVRQERSGDAEGAEGSGAWRFDDMLLDEPHSTQIRREEYRYDFTPYERFY